MSWKENMRVILLAYAILFAPILVQAQDAGTVALQQQQQQILMQQQQAAQSYQSPYSPVQCVTTPGLGQHSAGGSANSFDQFAFQQTQSLTTPLQTGLYVMNIPPWSTWQVVPWNKEISFSVKPGVVKPGTKVRLRWFGHGNVLVYYTTNGWSPNSSSPLYSGPITIDGPTHIQAIQLGWASGKGGCLMRTRSVILDASYDVPSSASLSANAAVVTDGLLRQGTKLKLITNATVDSISAKPGDKVPLLLDQDVTIGSTVVIPKGAPVDAVLVQVVPPQGSKIGGMLIVAVRSLNETGLSISLNGVETMEGRSGRAFKEAVIQPGMSLQATVTSDVKLKL
jgi:hypothetical protein